MRWLGDGVRHVVFGAVGATVAGSACTDRAIGDDVGNGGSDEATSDDDDSDEGRSDDGPVTTTGTSVTSTTGTSTSTSASTSTATSSTSVSTVSDGSDDGSDDGPVTSCVPPEMFGYYQFCLGSPDATGTCDCGPECQALTEATYWDQDCCDSCSYIYGGTTCSEVVDGECCFVTFVTEEGCGKGRPFVVDGCARVAAISAGREWATPGSDAMPSLRGLDADLRARLAVHWLATARAEHASIASFARFTMQLLALGAPPELLADAQRAALDEVEHARVAFVLASAYYGTAPLGPGALAVEHSLAGVGDPAAVLRSLVQEGCIDETIAATEAAVAAARAEDPAVRRALERIADDEARHAALAWRTAKWMLARWPELAPVAQETLAAALARRNAMPGAAGDRGCPEHGMLGDRDTSTIAAECLARTIVPAMATLLRVA